LFWEELERKNPGLAKAKGVYIFGIRAGLGVTPHYVGQARSTLGFYGEVFSHRNCNNYNQVIHSKQGTPIISLVARPKIRGKGFVSPGKYELDFMEKLMIGMALAKNEDLINIHHTRNLREITLPGIIGNYDARKRLTNAQGSLKQLLGID